MLTNGTPLIHGHSSTESESTFEWIKKKFKDAQLRLELFICQNHMTSQVNFYPSWACIAVCIVDRESYGSNNRCSVLVLTGVLKFLFWWFQFTQVEHKFEPHIAKLFNQVWTNTKKVRNDPKLAQAHCTAIKLDLREVILVDSQCTMDLICNWALEKGPSDPTRARA
jgi:hypothetical protein